MIVFNNNSATASEEAGFYILSNPSISEIESFNCKKGTLAIGVPFLTSYTSMSPIICLEPIYKGVV